jgi:HK97 gp10 family phage protein
MATDLVRIEGLESVLKTLRELPAEVVSKNGGPVRAALRRGAVIIQKQAMANVQEIVDTPNVDGRFVSTGLAKQSIRIKRVRPLNKQRGEAFIVSVRSQRYPNRTIQRKGRKGADLKTNDVLFMLEAGTERRRAMPWMRPAFEAKKGEALQVFATELPRAIDRAVKKLAMKNGART